jgi:hypothetical protein
MLSFYTDIQVIFDGKKTAIMHLYPNTKYITRLLQNSNYNLDSLFFFFLTSEKEKKLHEHKTECLTIH